MSLPIDLGDASLVLQLVIFFLLIIGLPLVKGVGIKKNFMIHGRLTFLALILHTVLIFVAMVPSLGDGFGANNGFSFSNAFLFWSHVILGTIALTMGFTVIVFWVYKPQANMACLRVKKLMAPILIIWAISLINGALLHILKIT